MRFRPAEITRGDRTVELGVAAGRAAGGRGIGEDADAAIGRGAVEAGGGEPGDAVERLGRGAAGDGEDAALRDFRRGLQPVEQVAAVQGLVNQADPRPHAAHTQIDRAVEDGGRRHGVHRQGRRHAGIERRETLRREDARH